MAMQNKHLNGAKEQGVLKAEHSLCPSGFSEVHFAGNLDILNGHSIGFCGSRDVSEKGQKLALDCAEQAVEKDLIIISGYARGVDNIVHTTALQKGGKTVIVLPEGMNHFRIKSDLKKHWDWRRVLVLSQFPVDAIWRAYRAMQRNRLIVNLIDVMVVIEAREKGGTLNAGEETLKCGIPLYVSVYGEKCAASSGNHLLLQRGAKRLMKSRCKNRANMDDVFETVFVQNSSKNNHSQLSLYGNLSTA